MIRSLRLIKAVSWDSEGEFSNDFLTISLMMKSVYCLMVIVGKECLVAYWEKVSLKMVSICSF